MHMKLTPQIAWPFAVILTVLASDQWTKWLVLNEPRMNALACLDAGLRCGRIELALPVDLQMVWNRGMSYGLFQAEGAMRWVLAGVMLAIAIGFLVWLMRADGRWLKLSLALVIGGAIGNLIDRIRFGAVVDFIDVNQLTANLFPWVFNIADAAISVGAVLLFIDQFILERGRTASSRAATPRSGPHMP